MSRMRLWQHSSSLLSVSFCVGASAGSPASFWELVWRSRILNAQHAFVSRSMVAGWCGLLFCVDWSTSCVFTACTSRPQNSSVNKWLLAVSSGYPWLLIAPRTMAATFSPFWRNSVVVMCLDFSLCPAVSSAHRIALGVSCNSEYDPKPNEVALSGSVDSRLWQRR